MLPISEVGGCIFASRSKEGWTQPQHPRFQGQSPSCFLFACFIIVAKSRTNCIAILSWVSAFTGSGSYLKLPDAKLEWTWRAFYHGQSTMLDFFVYVLTMSVIIKPCQGSPQGFERSARCQSGLSACRFFLRDSSTSMPLIHLFDDEIGDQRTWRSKVMSKIEIITVRGRIVFILLFSRLSKDLSLASVW